MNRVVLVFCAALFCLTTFAPASTLPVRQPLAVRQLPARHHSPRPKGKWYMASTGHAVYCYGPVMIVGTWDGGFARVATVCRGGMTMVKLKD